MIPLINDKRISLGLLPWRRRDLPVTASPRQGMLVVMTDPVNTPKEHALLSAILRCLNCEADNTPLLAPSTPLPRDAQVVLQLGEHTTTTVPIFTLPTLEHLLNNPLEKRQAERILRDCRLALSIP